MDSNSQVLTACMLTNIPPEILSTRLDEFWTHHGIQILNSYNGGAYQNVQKCLIDYQIK